MSISDHDLAHLLALVETAKAHAEAAGPDAQAVAHLLEQALGSTRALQARGGAPDEGIRPEDLTTENDK